MDGIYDYISVKVFSFFLLVKQKKDYLDYSALQLKLLAIPSAPFYHDFRDTYCSMQDFLFCFLTQFFRKICFFVHYYQVQPGNVVLDFCEGFVIQNAYVGLKQDCSLCAVVISKRKRQKYSHRDLSETLRYTYRRCVTLHFTGLWFPSTELLVPVEPCKQRFTSCHPELYIRCSHKN